MQINLSRKFNGSQMTLKSQLLEEQEIGFVQLKEQTEKLLVNLMSSK